MGRIRPSLIGAAAWVLAGALLAGCSGDDAEKVSSDTESRRTTTTGGGGKGDSDSTSTSVSSTSVTTTTSPFGDTIDLSDAPPVLMLAARAAFYFSGLMDEPEYRAGPVERGESFLVSPDAKLLAVATPGDAVRKARVELISTDSGKAVKSFELDSDTVTLSEWSPDSSAVVARTSVFTVLRTDGTTQEIVTPSGGGTIFASAATVATAVDCRNCSSSQLTDSKGRPVAVTVDRTGTSLVSGTYNASTSVVDPFDGAWGSAELQAMECARFTLVTGYVGDGQKYALLDADTRKLIPIEPFERNAGCPVASFDGSNVAVALDAGGTAVITVATGAATTVARQGIPLGWSKDGAKLAVQGNGTFVVGSDGAGGKEASVLLRRLCRIGTTGKVLAEVTGSTPDNSGLAVYDIATDSASLVGNFGLGATCDVSKDGNWMLTGDTIVDLERAEASVLRRQDADGYNIGGELRFPAPGRGRIEWSPEADRRCRAGDPHSDPLAPSRWRCSCR